MTRKKLLISVLDHSLPRTRPSSNTCSRFSSIAVRENVNARQPSSSRSMSQAQLKLRDDYDQAAPRMRPSHRDVYKLQRVNVEDPGAFGESSRQNFLPSVRGRARPAVAVHNPRAVRAAAELRARVDALVLDTAPHYEPAETTTYSDEELRSIYTDLLSHEETEEVAALKPVEASTTEMSGEEIQEILDGVSARLFPTEAQTPLQETEGQQSSFSELLRRRERDDSQAETSASGAASLFVNYSPQTQTQYGRIVSRLEEIIAGLETVPKHSSPIGNELLVPISILSNTEWKALVYQTVREGDLDVSLHTLHLMKRAGLQLPEELKNVVLKSYAAQGNVSAVESFIANLSDGKPSEIERDLHIKSHLRSPSPLHNVTTALTVLHKYESLAIAPPPKSYTRLIGNLFHEGSAQFQAQAWDLFAHMRYVAHPYPDAFLYSVMIRACAGTGPTQKSYSTEPERALDLWTEMTVDRKMKPTVYTYNAIILACARSKKYVTEAFRLAREMLDSQRDAFGNSAMRPDAQTFAALLVAAKGTGDLGRARWILAEMLNYLKTNPEEAPRLNSSHMRHIFHAYSAYRPPFRRGDTKIVDQQETEPEAAEAPVANDDVRNIKTQPKSKQFIAHIPPQSHSEIIAEATALFHRIVADKEADGSRSSEGSEDKLSVRRPFADVKITEALLESYIAVYYSHGSLAEARKLFEGLYERFGHAHSLRSYADALARCANTNPTELEEAEAFSNSIWQKWDSALKSISTPPNTTRARSIEQAYAARIRLLTYTNRLNDALVLLRTFMTKYPPKMVKKPPPKLGIRSTRTVLFAPKPLIRLVSSTEIPDDTVPPLLAFSDLEMLHHRLLVAGRMNDVAYVKWFCKSYEGALRRRREQAIRSKKLDSQNN